MTLLDGKVAFVTGAAAGLGAAIADALARHGAVGVAVDREPVDAPVGWLAAAADVRDEQSLQNAVSLAEKGFGRLDVVVANAGVVPPWSAIDDLDLTELDAVFAVNVRGVAATIKAAARPLADRGSVVAMASLNAYRAYPKQGIYTSSKHAVLGLVRTAAYDLGRRGIRVNAIGPGPIATQALRDRMARRAEGGGLPVDEALAAAADETALGRMATVEDVANVAVFLASDLSAGMTGALLPVDGGLGFP